MARVSKIKFEFLGETNEVPVNCGSSGVFTCKIPAQVASALQIHQDLSAKTLSELEKEFFAALSTFKESTRSEEVLICIIYKASGSFQMRADGMPMFGGYRNKYCMEMSSWDYIDAVGFEYNVLIKETINAKFKYFEARKGESNAFNKDNDDPNKWYKWSEFSVKDGHKLIPYSEEAEATLKRAAETIRKMSEMLFDFIEKDPALIEAHLKNQTLIG